MTPGGLYLFLGPDRARKLQRIQELERALQVDALDRHHVDGADISAADLVALCRQRPSVSAVRLIVVDQAHRIPRDGIEALLGYAGLIAETACVVLLIEVELSARHALASSGRGTGRTADGPVTVERFPGRDLSATKPFALVDALGSRDVRGALVAVQDQLAAGKDPLELFAQVSWQLQRWVTVKRLVETGASLERIAATAGMRPWQVERVQAELRGRSLRALEELLMRCWQLEADVKTGRAMPWLAVEQLVMEICQPQDTKKAFV